MRRLALAVVAASLVVTGAACSASNPEGSGGGGKSGHTLVVDMSADVETMDPAVTVDNHTWKVTYPAYERLVGYKGSTTDLKPDLAKSWKVSDNGLVWTIQIAPGHKFADGSPVDAKAVKFSFDRVLKVNKGPAGTFAEVKKVEAPSKMTVRFTLKNAFAPFVSTLATNQSNIVNPKVMEHEQDGDMGQAYLANHTMGSGPYQVESHVKGQSVTLTLNPNYSGSKPDITKAVFQVVDDPSAQRLQIEKGQVDIAEGIPADQLKEMEGTEDLTILDKPSFTVDYVYINVGKNGAPALKKTQVRQAINYAVDYKGIIQASQQGHAKQMRGPIPEGMWGHDPKLKQYHTDLKKAKQLMAKANVGDVEPLTLLYSDHWPWWPTEALSIQASLKKIGIPVELKKTEYATMRSLLDKGSFDLSLGTWSPDFADPYMFMNYWYDSDNGGLAGNRSFYSNPKVDHLIRTAAKVSDKAQRTKLYQQAQKIVVDDPPYVYLYQKDFQLPLRSNVKGMVFNPMTRGIYNLADMSKS
ncbi:MAG: ABC transporter substrate-binding protein [Nocardioidaceae bacterium]